jgi:hypothetical protein
MVRRGRRSAAVRPGQKALCVYPVRIGTCGWSYQDWSGAFYPEGLAAGEFLS